MQWMAQLVTHINLEHNCSLTCTTHKAIFGTYNTIEMRANLQTRTVRKCVHRCLQHKHKLPHSKTLKLQKKTNLSRPDIWRLSCCCRCVTATNEALLTVQREQNEAECMDLLPRYRAITHTASRTVDACAGPERGGCHVAAGAAHQPSMLKSRATKSLFWSNSV